MTLSVVQLVIIVCAVLFLFIGYDSFKRQKINGLHLIIFSMGVAGVLTLIAFPGYQNKLAQITGVARGADIIIYTSIICGVFGYFQLINSNTKTHFQLTRLISQTAISNRVNQNTLPIKNNDKPGILMRAYNEEKRVCSVLNELVREGYDTIVIVNDGSKDSTAEKIIEFKEKHPNIDIIDLHHTINRGGGSGNKTLFSFVSRYGKKIGIDWWATIDADGQMDVLDIEKFYKVAKKSDYQVIFGTRFVEGAKIDNFPIIRKTILRGGRLLIKVMYGTGVNDPHNGMRLFSTQSLEKIQIDSDTFNYANEIIEQVSLHKLKYTELPTHIIYTDDTLAKGQQNSNAIKMLVEMIYKKFFYR